MNPDHDVQACHDQFTAAARDYAEGCRDVFDAFLRQEFTRDEALVLVCCFLDGQQVSYAST